MVTKAAGFQRRGAAYTRWRRERSSFHLATLAGRCAVNFENSFTVPVPAADVWGAMMDFERVAPCMPGAEVTERTGDNSYKVQVRVKLGPMAMTYRGEAQVTDRDEEARTAAMRVQARETRGQGSANAVIQISVGEEGAGTRATMTTELKLSGRAAAMGRGVITDVSQALVSEFADNLSQMLSEGQGDGAGGPVAAPAQEKSGGPAAASAERPAPGPPVAASAEPAAAPHPEPPPHAETAPSAPQPGVETPPSAPQPAAEAPPSAPQPPPKLPPPPQSAPPQSSKDALDAAQLARSVVLSRFREPRTVLAAGALLALASLALGFRLGRRAGRR
jgi:uncharacterized protein